MTNLVQHYSAPSHFGTGYALFFSLPQLAWEKKAMLLLLCSHFDPSFQRGATRYDCCVMLGYRSYNSMRTQSTRQTPPLFEKGNHSDNLLDEITSAIKTYLGPSNLWWKGSTTGILLTMLILFYSCLIAVILKQRILAINQGIGITSI